MKLRDLIADARVKVRDITKPYLWPDDDWLRFANNAEREACRRARLIVDSSNAMTVIAINTTAVSYPLDRRILFVRRAKLDSRAQPLSPVHIADLDERFLGWESETGEPRHYVKDMDSHAIRLYPKTTIADTLRMTVVRLPLRHMERDTDEPEIRPHLHRSLVYWMLYEAYSDADVEKRDEKKAADNLAFFEDEFGKKSSAIDEAWIERNHGYLEGEGLF